MRNSSDASRLTDDVVQARAHARRAAAVQQQPVRGGEQHLEEDEQVEQVAGEEGAVQAHELQLEQRMEVHAGPVPAGEREEQRREADGGGEHQHQRGEPVEREDDAERRRPVAGQVDARRSGRATSTRSSRTIATARPSSVEATLSTARAAVPLLAEHEQHGRRRAAAAAPARAAGGDRRQRRHGRSSSPSTWSVSVRPRSASSTTRNSAVVAKLMTIAVSTSACGIGSV